MYTLLRKARTLHVDDEKGERDHAFKNQQHAGYLVSRMQPVINETLFLEIIDRKTVSLRR